ncbi:MAG: lysophospholipid acyltransferase family protein [Candidatus Thermoplasmatota archaeon]|nr:lysophospholipid acyltransferase family protein [Candidatus Thermoplasmatota archaeon]
MADPLAYLPERIFLKPIIMRFLIKSVEGAENLGRDTPYIFASNHNSHFDEFVLMPPIFLSTKRITHFFADRKHWFQGKLYFRLLAWRFKAIPVDRGKGTGDQAILRGVKMLEKGHNVIIYPEGTRGSCFEVGKGRIGVAKMSLLSRTPVVPVGVYGTHLLMPKGDHKPKIKRVVKIKIGEPIHFTDCWGRDPDEEMLRSMTDRIMTEIAKLLGQEYKHCTGGSQSTSP